MIRVITESQLRRIVKESVKRVLRETKSKRQMNEIHGGWYLDDEDITLVNDESCGRNLYIVKLWWGSGYALDCFNAFANSEEEALCYTVVYIEEHNPELLEETDNGAEQLKQELVQENPDYDEYEVEELPEFVEKYMYIDATMEGANSTHYIYSENARVDKYPQQHNYPMAKKLRK